MSLPQRNENAINTLFLPGITLELKRFQRINNEIFRFEMDFLESLNVPALPEQQTRISDKVSSKLESNPNIRLGFDACCSCAKKLELSSKVDVCCKGCRRVWYCSKECRREDAHFLSKANEEEQAHGHTSVICALLRLCQIEDDLEEPPFSSSKKRHFLPTSTEIEAAHDRIRSEYESYPATLANVLMDAPCIQSLLETYSKSDKRSKTMRRTALDSKSSLTIHVIGASHDAELWGSFHTKNHSSCEDVYDAYAEALHELVSDLKGLRALNLIFVGPNCPSKNQHIVRVIDPQQESFDEKDKSKKRMRCSDQWHHKRNSVELLIETYRSNYDNDFLRYGKSKREEKKNEKVKVKIDFTVPRKPDVVVFFNPGFTCPDYSWDSALLACQTLTSATGSKIPFFVTTNTEMEAVSDLQYLFQHSFIDSIPLAVADIVSEGIQDHDTDAVDYDTERMMFFGENPSAGTRVRQSGNMANDLFVKNRYIFGGTFSGSFDKKYSADKNGSIRIPRLNIKHDEQEMANKSIEKKSTARRKLESNSKKKNFALM